MMNSKKFVLVLDSDKSLIQSFNYRTEFKQKAAAVRLAEKLMRGSYKGDKIVVMAYDVYVAYGYDKLTRKVRNMMTGEMVDEPINTPYFCSVASESYWSM